MRIRTSSDPRKGHVSESASVSYAHSSVARRPEMEIVLLGVIGPRTGGEDRGMRISILAVEAPRLLTEVLRLCRHVPYRELREQVESDLEQAVLDMDAGTFWEK